MCLISDLLTNGFTEHHYKTQNNLLAYWKTITLEDFCSVYFGCVDIFNIYTPDTKVVVEYLPDLKQFQWCLDPCAGYYGVYDQDTPAFNTIASAFIKGEKPCGGL